MSAPRVQFLVNVKHEIQISKRIKLVISEIVEQFVIQIKEIKDDKYCGAMLGIVEFRNLTDFFSRYKSNYEHKCTLHPPADCPHYFDDEVNWGDSVDFKDHVRFKDNRFRYVNGAPPYEIYTSSHHLRDIGKTDIYLTSEEAKTIAQLKNVVND